MLCGDHFVCGLLLKFSDFCHEGFNIAQLLEDEKYDVSSHAFVKEFQCINVKDLSVVVFRSSACLSINL